MYNRIIAYTVFLVLIFPVVSGEIATLGTFQQKENIVLKQSGPSLSSCTVLSVDYPNSTQASTSLSMTQSGNLYTVSFNKTDALGEYIVSGECTDISANDIVWAYNLFVTPSGKSFDTAQAILNLVLLAGGTGLCILFFWFALIIPYTNEINEEGFVTRINKKKYIKLLCIWFAFGSLVLFLTTLSSAVNNFYALQSMKSFVTNIYLIFYYLFYFITILVLIIAFLEIWRDVLYNKEIIKYGKALLKG